MRVAGTAPCRQRSMTSAAGQWTLCYCAARRNGCDDREDFVLDFGTLHILGPLRQDLTCFAGPCRAQAAPECRESVVTSGVCASSAMVTCLRPASQVRCCFQRRPSGRTRFWGQFVSLEFCNRL